MKKKVSRAISRVKNVNKAMRKLERRRRGKFFGLFRLFS